MFSVCKKAGKPLPRFDEDDVIDYMVTEAIVLKQNKEEAEQLEKSQKDDWKKDFSRLQEYAE